MGVQGHGQVVGVVLGQDDEDARFGVHEAVGGGGDVLAAGVGAVVVVFFVQGGADDPADLVLGFGEGAADDVAERGFAGLDFGVFGGRSGVLGMRDWRVLRAAVSGVTDGIAVDGTCSLGCVRLREMVSRASALSTVPDGPLGKRLGGESFGYSE